MWRNDQTFPQATHTADPVSSHEAERDVTMTGARQTNLTTVITAVRMYPGLPASSLATVTGLDVVEVRRRLSDARSTGLAVQGALVRPKKGRAEVSWFPVGGDEVQSRMFE